MSWEDFALTEPDGKPKMGFSSFTARISSMPNDQSNDVERSIQKELWSKGYVEFSVIHELDNPPASPASVPSGVLTYNVITMGTLNNADFTHEEYHVTYDNERWTIYVADRHPHGRHGPETFTREYTEIHHHNRMLSPSQLAHILGIRR
jgi:hypothetical protein